MIVMFVDDEMLILNGLKRTFYKCGWTILLAISGEMALDKLKNHPIDLVVTDMRMPHMDGAQLLEKISVLYPHIVRIILSGFADQEAAKRASFVAHQWFNKPCEPEVLEQTISNIFSIRQSLPNIEIQKLVGKIKSLPSPPKIYMKLNTLLGDKTIDMKEISAVIANDPSLVAKILQLTNTSFFSNGKQLNNLTEAITRLGVDLVCAIVVAAETYTQLEEIPGYSIEDEQTHCLITAKFAATMVEPALKQETILVGLLHNIGKFILSKVSPETMHDYIKQRVTGDENISLEHDLFQADHVQLAGYLLHLWNFSYKLIENIVHHHQPEKLIGKEFGSGTAVYIASRLLRKQQVSEELISHFNIDNKLEFWKKKAIDYL
jgi:HD-like signal output (HDOD) protein